MHRRRGPERSGLLWGRHRIRGTDDRAMSLRGPDGIAAEERCCDRHRTRERGHLSGSGHQHHGAQRHPLPHDWGQHSHMTIYESIIFAIKIILAYELGKWLGKVIKRAWKHWRSTRGPLRQKRIGFVF